MDVSHLAKLSKLTVSKDQAKKLASGFTETLKTINLLSELKTSSISSTSQVTGLKNVFRQDKLIPEKTFTQKQALSNAKKTYKGYFLVPYVFHDSIE